MKDYNYERFTDDNIERAIRDAAGVENKTKFLHRRLDLLLRTGKLLMESAADTGRIYRSLNRVAAFLGLPEDKLHIYVDYNMLMVNFGDEAHSYTKFQHCDKHGINMHALSDLSNLSWKSITNDYSIDRYEEELEKIANRKRNYSPWVTAIGAGFACGGFCIQFGCDWIAFLYASIAAIIGFRFKDIMMKRGFNSYMSMALATLISTIIAWSSYMLLPQTSNTPLHPLMACALFIVPGVPLINFVDDMLDNYISVGTSRAIHTALMLIAMSFGIALFIRLYDFSTGSSMFQLFENIPMTPHHSYWEYAVAAAISAMGFSMIFNIPKRLLPVVAIGGIITVCTRNFVNLGPSTNNIGLDMGIVIGSLIGSTLISLIAVKFAKWFRVPNHVITIPSVIPMIPGVLMYRFLVALIEMDGIIGEVTNAVKFGMAATLTILAIAIGVAIPNVFARKLIERKFHNLLNTAIESRRKRGKFVDLSKV